MATCTCKSVCAMVEHKKGMFGVMGSVWMRLAEVGRFDMHVSVSKLQVHEVLRALDGTCHLGIFH